MTLSFPDLDTLRLVLNAGLIPSDITRAPAHVGSLDDGTWVVDSPGKLTKKAIADLDRLGVRAAPKPSASLRTVSCWPEALPLERLATLPPLAASASVIFELPAPEFPAFVTELLRLGNDRQAVQWAGEQALLLRVIGPPYYTLLRALEPGDRSVRAFTEAAPSVWVELGYSHPFAQLVKPPENQSLFLAYDRPWRMVPEGPFTDIYDQLTFNLPVQTVDWSDTSPTDPVAVPLRLVAGNATEQPELWVLRGAATEQLDTLVRDADERLIARLRFAVATGPAGVVVVLRTTASKFNPPVLPLSDVTGYRPFHKLPNLYVPIGQRLHPNLRRDVTRELLAPDPDRLVWLTPGPLGEFTPESVSEDSFRPLDDWVEYIVEANTTVLSDWAAATQFGFEPFVCAETGAKPPKPPGSRPEGPRAARPGTERADLPLTPAPPPEQPATSAGPLEFAPAPEETVTRPPSEWLLRRQELEQAFLELDGPIDAPTRQLLWPELAAANAGHGDLVEAAVCWLNAAWPTDSDPVPHYLAWAKAESGGTPTVEKLNRLIAAGDLTASEAREFVSTALALAATQPAAFAARSAAVKACLEAQESKLPPRVVWLLAHKLATTQGLDTLGLARTRDRLLQRLLEEGLRPERDLPFFLRSAGLHGSERLRHMRDGATSLHQTARNWVQRSLKAGPQGVQSERFATLAYVDFFFAYSFAKLGEATFARQLADQSRAALSAFDPASDLGIAGNHLAKAFTACIETALASLADTAASKAELTAEFDTITRQATSNQKNDNHHRLAHYAISRMREQSRILEQQERLNPYLNYQVENDALRKAIVELQRLRDSAALARAIRELYRGGATGPSTAESRFLVLVNALPLAGRTGEAFTVELLSLVPETLRGVAAQVQDVADSNTRQGQLLERALFFAAHFDRREFVQQIVDFFVELLTAKPAVQRYELVNVVVPQCLRSLRKMNLRDETDKLLHRVRDVLLGDQSPTMLRDRYASQPDQWVRALQSLLTLAGGWLSFGLTGQAEPILDLTRTELLGPARAKVPAKDFTALAQRYIGALGHAPASEALHRLTELFQSMEPNRIANGWTTAKFYSRFHLNLIEEVALALVNEEFTLGQAGQRWLEEDEYVIRRRVHADTRQLVASTDLASPRVL